MFADALGVNTFSQYQQYILRRSTCLDNSNALALDWDVIYRLGQENSSTFFSATMR